MEYCSRCMAPEPLNQTVYGNHLCDDCWDEYINSEQGKVEYFILITNGAESISAFDADALGEIVVSWKNNKHLINLDEDEIEEIEAAAFKLGILE